MLHKKETKSTESIDKKQFKKQSEILSQKIIAFQKKMNAEGKHSLLMIFQGMDASGKDGSVRRVLSGINPNGCIVKSFKKPTDEEYAHDFLWRVYQNTPAKGMIQVFNRSHYEDILVPSVLGFIPKEEIEKRYEMINNFEKMIESNGTTILKFYLHVSKEEQLERLQERVNNPEKHFKHKDGDWKTREDWDKYMEVYQTLFERCNNIPWHIIPSDQNWYKTNLISKVIVDAFEKMNMKWPELDSELF